MLRKILITSILATVVGNSHASQCPPNNALQFDNQEWFLDANYIAQGWELVYQSPKLKNSYLKFVPPGMALFVNLSEHNTWKSRCIYYVPLNNPHEKAALIVESQQGFDPENIFQPKFIYQPNTLTYVCQSTAGDSSSCVWL